jgi:hypothetical protein
MDETPGASADIDANIDADSDHQVEWSNSAVLHRKRVKLRDRSRAVNGNSLPSSLADAPCARPPVLDTLRASLGVTALGPDALRGVLRVSGLAIAARLERMRSHGKND